MQFLKNNNVKHICMYFGHLYDVLCETFSQISCIFKLTHPLIAGLWESLYIQDTNSDR